MSKRHPRLATIANLSVTLNMLKVGPGHPSFMVHAVWIRTL